MAGLDIDIREANHGPLAAGTPRTVLQIIAASTTKVLVGSRRSDNAEIEVSFDGTSGSDEPVLCEVIRQTNAIGGSPVTVTPSKSPSGADGTIQTTAAASAGGTEPTTGTVLYSKKMHPQGAHFIRRRFLVEQGDRLGFVFTSPVATPKPTISVPAEE